MNNKFSSFTIAYNNGNHIGQNFCFKFKHYNPKLLKIAKLLFLIAFYWLFSKSCFIITQIFSVYNNKQYKINSAFSFFVLKLCQLFSPTKRLIFNRRATKFYKCSLDTMFSWYNRYFSPLCLTYFKFFGILTFLIAFLNVLWEIQNFFAVQ